jgi:hypothetical protein
MQPIGSRATVQIQLYRTESALVEGSVFIQPDRQREADKPGDRSRFLPHSIAQLKPIFIPFHKEFLHFNPHKHQRTKPNTN